MYSTWQNRYDDLEPFAANDHRPFNRDGQAFNVGETFAGLPYVRGVELADMLKISRRVAASRQPWAELLEPFRLHSPTTMQPSILRLFVLFAKIGPTTGILPVLFVLSPSVKAR